MLTKERLIPLLESFRSKRVLVVGDLMLDEFIWGRVSRISPEAPVPVVEVQRESHYPGGAANVARNLRPFCSYVGVLGLVGTCRWAKGLLSLLAKEGISSDGLVHSENCQTIVKTRIIARNQQVVRVDRERKAPPDAAASKKLTEALRALVPKMDAVIIEDYGKGLLSQEFADQIISLAKEHGKIVTVDPNPHNPLTWSGVDTIKPNRAEAYAAAGIPDPGPIDQATDDADLRRVADLLRQKWDSRLLLITLGEHGMLLLNRDGTSYHTPTRARQVFDLSGAGDTAIALFTLALTSGAEPWEAAEIANHASGVVVGKLGTETVTVDELIESFDAHP